MFDSILGNEPIKAYLKKAIQEERFPHALIFAGIDGIGKSLFAKELVIFFLKTTSARIEKEIHPDFYPVRPDGKSAFHSIDAMRSMIGQVHSAPFEAPAKVFLIYDAEKMQQAAANSLLKTLEEPLDNTYFILLSTSMQEILPTIASRCTLLHFQPLETTDIASLLKKREIPDRFASLAQGSVGKAIELSTKAPIEEMIFPLLADRKPYFELHAILEKIEKAIENEDPIQENKRAEDLFTSIFMWYRDQWVRTLGRGDLFFPSAQKASVSLPSLEKIEIVIDEARLAYQRHIKLSTCLEKILISQQN